MAIALIIHGSFGKAHYNWFPWLKKELEKLGYTVYLPQFPLAEEQNLTNWFDTAKDIIAKLDENSIIVGHSCGAVFALRILEQLEKQIRAVFLVSGFTKLLGKPELEMYDKVNRTFVERPFLWDTIKQKAKQIIIYYGDNDPYVPLDQAQEIAEGTEGNFKLVSGGGHLNKEFGYTEFPLLLEDIKSAA